MVAALEPHGRREAEHGPRAAETVGRRQLALNDGPGQSAPPGEDVAPAGPAIRDTHAVEREGEAVAAEPGRGHALDGEKGVGLELGGLAEEEEVEVERIAGRGSRAQKLRASFLGWRPAVLSWHAIGGDLVLWKFHFL
jgi:hypothetical protein